MQPWIRLRRTLHPDVDILGLEVHGLHAGVDTQFKLRVARASNSLKVLAGSPLVAIRAIGKQLDADIERDIAKLPQSVADVQIRK
ncbi:hypothetical protein N234_37510 [Ralstonia pickettii DTP0602]|nr:hypothetical protein N234_37510 [Ralstonia pickettii DTP0602]